MMSLDFQRTVQYKADKISGSYRYDPENYKDGFKSPASEYRWHTLLHHLPQLAEREDADAIFDGIAEEGLGGVVTNVPMIKEYIDDENAFPRLNKAVKMLRDRGLDAWLYDEYGYPSGSAGGRTTLGHKELVARGIVCNAVKGFGYTSVTVTKDSDEEVIGIYLAYAIDENGNRTELETDGESVSFSGTEGDWTLYVFSEKYLYKGTHAETNGSGGRNWLTRDYPNLLDADATRAFINNTYKPYAEKLDGFDEVVGIFTDEPSLMEIYQNNSEMHKFAQAVWSKQLPEEFERMHGYKITDKLHLVFNELTDEAKTVRVNFRQTVAKLFAENYFGLLAKFCDEHGTRSSGHCLLEESVGLHGYYYGDLMQCLRQMSIPGVDALTGKIDGYLSGWPIFMAVKYATSTATLKGDDRLVMEEFAPVDVNNEHLDENEFNNCMGTLNLMFFSGVTMIHAYIGSGAFGDVPKRRELTDYFGRIAYISRHAKWDSGVAVYYPINTVQAYTIPCYSARLKYLPQINLTEPCMKILKSRLDFTVADNIFLKEAKVENGRLFNDHVSFTSIVMPSIEVIPLDILKKLIEFEQSGGTVIWSDRVPEISDKLSDNEAVKALSAELTAETFDGSSIEKLRAAMNDKLVIGSDSEFLFKGRYKLDGKTMYWLYNNGSEILDFEISYDGASGFDVYDAESGEIVQAEGDKLDMSLNAYRAKLVVVLS